MTTHNVRSTVSGSTPTTTRIAPAGYSSISLRPRTPSPSERHHGQPSVVTTASWRCSVWTNFRGLNCDPRSVRRMQPGSVPEALISSRAAQRRVQSCCSGAPDSARASSNRWTVAR